MHISEVAEDPDTLDTLANKIINRLSATGIIQPTDKVVGEAYQEIEEAVKEFAEELE